MSPPNAGYASATSSPFTGTLSTHLTTRSTHPTPAMPLPMHHPIRLTHLHMHPPRPSSKASSATPPPPRPSLPTGLLLASLLASEPLQPAPCCIPTATPRRCPSVSTSPPSRYGGERRRGEATLPAARLLMASGTIPPYASTLKGSSSARCCAAVSLYLSCFCCCRFRAAPVAVVKVQFLTMPGASW